MKIIKPDPMAVVHRALRLQGQDRLCVGLIALFPAAMLFDRGRASRYNRAPGIISDI